MLVLAVVVSSSAQGAVGSGAETCRGAVGGGGGGE
eukprot:CAMPEP_0172461560 /NCGR_PEP_ID=MMETSP1065-20121228/40940_1 /TAXON_ID=265537 /ORGANISM="Amphiprora paludosa, Strain CCMP125" /LENGTH=34 /DNA_ID= /DNA_START= /DNA_END= /DNA_ORIENTATION=